MTVRFVPYDERGDAPNIVVDGAGTSSTLLTLSHWPGSSVPSELQADLSAEIALRYLEHPEHHVDIELVSNNHFDEDGLMGVYSIVAPDDALARRGMVVDVARAGDFGWSHTRAAARVAFAISRLADPETSSLAPTLFRAPYPEMAAAMYRGLLPMVGDLLDNPDRFRVLWAEEDAHLDESDAAIERGDVTIEELPDLDLAIVTTPPALEDRVVHRFTQVRHAVVHPMAVHNRTTMTRVAYVTGHRYEVQLRYETWVQLVSRRPPLRPELAPLAARLDELESGGTRWHSDDAEMITPRLAPDGDSAIEPADFVRELVAFLPDATPAWDPWTARH
ncbi:MAG TPA: DUF6687 family protein [Acidimicrobiales bacterium]|nr:DUF6687 family protein [Acidimicrobiales bacterium]